jgi:hypothetical protein
MAPAGLRTNTFKSSLQGREQRFKGAFSALMLPIYPDGRAMGFRVVRSLHLPHLTRLGWPLQRKSLTADKKMARRSGPSLLSGTTVQLALLAYLGRIVGLARGVIPAPA